MSIIIQIAYEVSSEAIKRVESLLDDYPAREPRFSGAEFEIERADFTCIPERDDEESCRLLYQIQAAIADEA